MILWFYIFFHLTFIMQFPPIFCRPNQAVWPFVSDNTFDIIYNYPKKSETKIISYRTVILMLGWYEKELIRFSQKFIKSVLIKFSIHHSCFGKLFTYIVHYFSLRYIHIFIIHVDCHRLYWQYLELIIDDAYNNPR